MKASTFSTSIWKLRPPYTWVSKYSGRSDRYKIKMRSVGYRLVYEIQDRRLVVLVIAVGRRDKNAVFKAAGKR